MSDISLEGFHVNCVVVVTMYIYDNFHLKNSLSGIVLKKN